MAESIQKPLEFEEHLQAYIRGRMISTEILTDPAQVFGQDWNAFTESEPFTAQVAEIERLLVSICAQEHPNEQQTKQDLIFPILQLLGWPDFLLEQNLSLGRQPLRPDILLFTRQKDKEAASKLEIQAKRYEHGICIGEFKRWNTNLDRHAGAIPSPTSQMLHYLRRNQDINNGRGAQWGLLTDGKKWRIYYARSQSVTEDFLEIDLGELLTPREPLPSVLEGFEPNIVKEHLLALFVFFFSREAFSNHDDQSRHLRAIVAGRHYELRVTTEMGEVIFHSIFPKIVQEIARLQPTASPNQLRDESLLFLFRLLFILYAEDRGLLPLHNTSYRYHRAFRTKVREKIRECRHLSVLPTTSSDDYWKVCRRLWQDIAEGNTEFSLPVYNGDLFDTAKTPILNEISFDDAFLTEIIEPLSFQNDKYINYRTLNVQHLGAIYEKLLDRKIVIDRGIPKVVSDPNSRKDTGSYYTPDHLVRLTVEKTLVPLVEDIYQQFEEELAQVKVTGNAEFLLKKDPAEGILELRVCDPAMGSAHFLVDTVDWLSDRVLEALAYCGTEIPEYNSPLSRRISEIRNSILERAQTESWDLLDEQLDDRQIVKRLVLKKCIYGVDLNPMAVELAKLSLWLHTFTVGAPLSFLNHHLKCGNSIFGCWIDAVAKTFHHDLFQFDLSRVLRNTTEKMRSIEDLPDTDLDEVRQSEELYHEIKNSISSVQTFLHVHLGLSWLRPTSEANAHDLQLAWLTHQTTTKAKKQEKEEFDAQVANWYEGRLGDPVHDIPKDSSFRSLWDNALDVAAQQRFLHWEVVFPGVWNHQSHGFDAIVGNPPWERMKFEEAEWIASHKPELAKNMTDNEKEKVFATLTEQGDPLVKEFYQLKAISKHTMDMVRQGSDYPLMSSGDINIYGLFAERALALLNDKGTCGLVLMSGIAADKSCVKFFQRISQQGRLRNFYHFENRRHEGGRHFPDVHAQLKFCIFVASAHPNGKQTHYGTFLDDVKNVQSEDRCFSLASEFFKKVNPNTGTLPILRNLNDKTILNKIYHTTPILHNHHSQQLLYPSFFFRMFDMTNHRKAGKMRTLSQLTEEESVWGLAHNVFDSAKGKWLPLYEGKMIWQFDHRSADVKFNPEALQKRASAEYLNEANHQDPMRDAFPQFWVHESDIESRFSTLAKQQARSNNGRSEKDLQRRLKTPFFLGFRDITNTTDRRTMISTIIPYSAVSNTLCLLLSDSASINDYALHCCLLAGNFGSLVFDYVARCKLHANHMNWFILEQMPVVPPELYDSTKFGPKTAREVVRKTVLELVYTSHSLKPFAAALEHVNENHEPYEPFHWDSDRRLKLRAKLDAVYFHLYGITDRHDIDHVHTLFSVEESAEIELYGVYKSKLLRQAWVKALIAGRPDAQVEV